MTEDHFHISPLRQEGKKTRTTWVSAPAFCRLTPPTSSLWGCVRIKTPCSVLAGKGRADEFQEFGTEISPGDVIPATDHVYFAYQKSSDTFNSYHCAFLLVQTIPVRWDIYVWMFDSNPKRKTSTRRNVSRKCGASRLWMFFFPVWTQPVLGLKKLGTNVSGWIWLANIGTSPSLDQKKPDAPVTKQRWKNDGCGLENGGLTPK